MMQRPHVPKFGTWDANSNGPAYTAVFDHARAGKGMKSFNPNDPAENEAVAGLYGGPPPQRSNDRPPPPRGRMTSSNHDQDEPPVMRPRHERRSSREDIEMRKPIDPPGRHPLSQDQLPARRPHAGTADEGSVPRYGVRGGSDPPPRRAIGERDGSHHSERGRGAASPAWDRRARQPSGDEGSVFAPGTPKNNSRLRTQGGTRPEEQVAKAGALPKFGAWDVKDPSAGDGFTMIFQKLSNEKKEGGPVHIPRLNTDSPARNAEDHHKHNQPNAPRKHQGSSPGCGCNIL